MNGFTNAILSLLLSWIRLFINSLWRLANSESGSHFLQFLSDYWKLLLLILCIGGFLVDRIVYLFRWRPYAVWLNKRRKLRRERAAYASQDEAGEAADEGPEAWEDPSAATRVTAPVRPATAYAPPPQATAVYQRPAADPAMAGGAPFRFAPAAARQAPVAPPPQPYTLPDDLSPVFDDDLGGWAQGDTLLRPEGSVSPAITSNIAHNMAPAFGSAMPEPIDYIRDMQAGFARPLPPEQLYSPPIPPPSPAPAEPAAPVHPGLDLVNLRRNFGLSPAGLVGPQAEARPEAPAFQPYAETEQIHRAAAQAAHSRNPFASLAKKARGFVGVTDDDDKPTIRDLQPVVDVKNAFHEPVYPKPLPKDGDRP